MTVPPNPNGQIGVEMASRLGLQLNRREGHDLAGACIACKSSDAFRLHEQTGEGYCYSCQAKWSPFQVAETVLQDREQAKALLIEMGVFPTKANDAPPAIDPAETIAETSHIPSAALDPPWPPVSTLVVAANDSTAPRAAKTSQ